MASLQEQIVLFNQWQYNPDFRLKTDPQPRDLYHLLINNFLENHISISISGLRRVGKTTILFQLINHLLNQKIPCRRILYFQFSQVLTNLEKVLAIFFSSLPDDEIDSHEFYIFLDELQHVKNWQIIVKNYIDRNQKIKFIVTGSASIYFRRRAQESLAGRILDFQLPPLSFPEMIRLKTNHREEYSFNQIIKSAGDKFAKFKKLQFERLGLKKLFNSFLKFGEFPALLNSFDNHEFSYKYLTDGIIDKILRQDIKLFEVEKEEEIFSLYKICCSNIAQMINLRNVSAETGLAYPTIKKYLSILKKTFLIKSVKNRLKSIRSQVKSPDKVFSTSINLAAAALTIADPLNPPYLDFKGHIIENFVFNSISELGDVHYYNQAGKEVDLIIEVSNQIIPLEVKTSFLLKKTDLNHLVFFMQKNKIKEGFLVYGGELNKRIVKDCQIYFLPYWLF